MIKCMRLGILMITTVASLQSCMTTKYVEIAPTTEYDTYGNEVEPEEPITYIASFYDNRGNNYMGLTGSHFFIEPNSEKHWGYNTDGKWTSWYETSSVVTITVDDYVVPTCGSTVLFMDSRIKMIPIDRDMLGTFGELNNGYTVESTSHPLQTYFGLTHWWYNTHEKGQGGAKIVIIQSQDGYDIGIIEGEDITWDIEGKLPKTTCLTVDGMPVYIHRCNFTILPTALFEQCIEYME